MVSASFHSCPFNLDAIYILTFVAAAVHVCSHLILLSFDVYICSIDKIIFSPNSEWLVCVGQGINPRVSIIDVQLGVVIHTLDVSHVPLHKVWLISSTSSVYDCTTS